MKSALTMRNITVDIDLFYYIEEDCLTWHCPQFALYGVTPYTPTGKGVEDFALETLGKKIGQRTDRFGSGKKFIASLIEHGHWKGDNIENARPMKVERYISSQPMLAKLANLPETKASRHSYTISVNG